MIPGANERWENYMQFTQSQLVPRFTPFGFEIVPIPEDLYMQLKEKMTTALVDWDAIREEQKIDAVHTPLPSKFVSCKLITMLTNRRFVLKVLVVAPQWDPCTIKS